MKINKSKINPLNSWYYEEWIDDKTEITIKHYIPSNPNDNVIWDYFVLIDKSIDSQERVIPIEIANSFLKLMK